MNLCILFYPNDDQATIRFIDYNMLSTSIDNYDQQVCKAIRRALLDPQGIDTVNAEASCEMTTVGNLKLPCQIDKQITLYLD